MSYNKEFFDVQSYVEFTKAQTLQELTSDENIALSLGKIARYYNNLVRSDLDIKVNGTLKNYYRPLNTSDNQIDFRAGTNISLTYDDTNNSITINSAAGGSSVSYTPIISSGTAIGALTIDGASNTLYYEETVGYKAITQHSEIDESTGSFVFSGAGAIFNDSGADYVGLQVGYSGDEFQIIGSGNSDDSNSLFIRRNDTPSDSTKWTNWSRLLTPASIKAINNTNPVSVTVNEITKGSYTIANGVTIGHKTLTATETASSKTLTYGGTFGAIESIEEDGYGHVSGMTITTYTMPDLEHIPITKSTDTTSTVSPGYGGTFNAIDSVTRDTYGHVTKINTKTITLPESERKVAVVGSNTAGSSGWYKVADGTLTGNNNTILKFFVHTSGSPGGSGILYLDIRSSSYVLSIKKFGWLVHDEYNTEHFIINIDDTTWTIYQYISRNRYYRDFWSVMDESGEIATTTSYTLYNSNSPEATSPVTSDSIYSEDYNDTFPYTATNPSSATLYGITFNVGTGGSTSDPSTRKYLRTNDGIRYYTREGTTSTTGYGYIILGNNIPTGTDGNKCGAVRCYTTGTGTYVQLSSYKDESSMRFSHSSGTSGNFSPLTDNIYDLGTSTERWKNIYASGAISGNTGTFSSALTVNGTASVNGINLYNPTTQMYINLLAPSNLNLVPDITFPKTSGTIALTSDIPKYTAGDRYTPIYFDSNGVPTAITSLNDDGGWLVYSGGSSGTDARLVTNRTIGHWNGRVGSAAGASNLCYFGCADLDSGFTGDLVSVGGAIFSTNSYFSNSTQKFTGIQIGDTRSGYRKMQLVTAGGSTGRIYARYSKADNPGVSDWSNPVSLLQSGDITAGIGINLVPSYVTFGDVTIEKGCKIDLDIDVVTSGSGNVVTNVSFIDDTLTVTKGIAPSGSAGSATQPVYVSSTGTVTAVTQPAAGAWESSVPYINSSSEMKIGRYLDFHNETSTNAYDVRLNNASTDYLTMMSANDTPNLILYGSKTRLRFATPTHSSVNSGITAYEVNADGLNMTIQCGGNMIIGSGESPTNFYNATKTDADYWSDTGERMFVTSDGNIMLMSNCNTIDNRKVFMMSTNGHFYMPPSGKIRFRYTDSTAADYHELQPPSSSTARTWTLPDKTGTIALTSDIPSVPTISATRQFATGVNIGSVTIDGTATIYLVPKGTASQAGAVTVSDSYTSSGGSASSSVAASSYAVNRVYQIANGKSSVSVGTDSSLKTTTLTVDGTTTSLCHSTPYSFQRINTANATYWRKVAAIAFTGASSNYCTTFLIHESYGTSGHKPQVGILAVNCRTGSTAGQAARNNCFMEWLIASSTITIGNFALLYFNGEDINGSTVSNSCRFEIWVKGRGNYSSYQISMLDAAAVTAADTKENWELYSVTSTSSSGQSALPTASGNPIYSTQMALLS